MVARRQYQVPGPNSLWHLDGNHKLFDGNSLCIAELIDFHVCVFTWLVQQTITLIPLRDVFLSPVAEFCRPYRVRSNHGMENVEVAQQIIACVGKRPGSHITGSPVHNQRIQQLWCNYFCCVRLLLYNLFYFMEDTGIFSSDSENDMFCLYFIFTPLINQALRLFKCSSNNHKLLTEGNLTPHQLYLTVTQYLQRCLAFK